MEDYGERISKLDDGLQLSIAKKKRRKEKASTWIAEAERSIVPPRRNELRSH